MKYKELLPTAWKQIILYHPKVKQEASTKILLCPEVTIHVMNMDNVTIESIEFHIMRLRPAVSKV